MSGSGDRTVKVWDVAKGQTVQSLPEPNRDVLGMAFSPDGKYLVAIPAATEVSLANVQGVAFSPDGKRLASASSKTVTVYAVEDGRTLFTLKEHRGTVWSVSFSGNGKQLASVSADHTVKVFDSETGKVLRSLRSGDTHSGGCVQFSPKADLLAVTNKKGVAVWDWKKEQVAFSLTAHAGPVSCVAFSPNGKLLATGSGVGDQRLSSGEVKVWDGATGKELLCLKGHTWPVTGLAFSPDSKWIASASKDRLVKVWNAATGEEARSLHGHLDAVTSVAYSPDGKRIFSGGEDGTIKVWDSARGQELLSLQGDRSHRPLSGKVGKRMVTCIAASPDGKCVASGNQDAKVLLWRNADRARGSARFPRPRQRGPGGGVSA